MKSTQAKGRSQILCSGTRLKGHRKSQGYNCQLAPNKALSTCCMPTISNTSKTPLSTRSKITQSTSTKRSSLVRANISMELSTDFTHRRRGIMWYQWTKMIWSQLKQITPVMDGVGPPFCWSKISLTTWWKIFSTLMAAWSTMNSTPASKFTFLQENT